MGLLFCAAILLQDGAVTGVVRLGHRAPHPRYHNASFDTTLPPVLVDNSLALGKDNQIRDALVVILGAPPRKVPSPLPVTVEIRNSQYEPRVVALLPGQSVRHVNRDATTHNVHSLATLNRERNEGLHPPSGQTTRTFDQAEEGIPVQCDIHAPWEQGRIHVFDHPYFAVTGVEGSYEIRGLPAGTYTLEVRHERCLPFVATVRVEAGKVTRLDVELATEEGPAPLRWQPYAAGAGAGGAALFGLLVLLARRK